MSQEHSTKIIADAFQEEYASLCAEFEQATKNDVLRRAAALAVALKAEQGRVALENPDYAAATILVGLYRAVPSKSDKSGLVSRLAEIDNLFSSLLDVGGKHGMAMNGSKGGRPKKRDMELVRDCWESWQQNPAQYPGPTAFARAMMAKWGEENGGTLASADSIEKTIRKWKRKHGVEADIA